MKILSFSVAGISPEIPTAKSLSRHIPQNHEQSELAVISHSSLVDSLLLLFSFFDLSQTIIKIRQLKPMNSGIMNIQNLLSGGAE
jgi:hypothetical protein